ncbi:protein of unknown function [Serratia sp. Tan611]|nr:protein of unknown function [Serratia sp. Tan611]
MDFFVLVQTGGMVYSRQGMLKHSSYKFVLLAPRLVINHFFGVIPTNYQRSKSGEKFTARLCRRTLFCHYSAQRK